MDDPSQDWERVRFIKRSESLKERERKREREREKTNGIEVERGSKR